jgi:hypothetical protein
MLRFGASQTVPFPTKGGMMRKLIAALLVTSALMFGMTASNAGATASPPASCQGVQSSDQASHGLLSGGVVADYRHSVGAEVFAEVNRSTAHCH